MRITRVDPTLVRLPPVNGRVSLQGPAAPPDAALLVRLHTDADLVGLGVVVTTEPTGRTLRTAIRAELAPLLIGEPATAHERLAARIRADAPDVPTAARAAIDIAVWDLKGKASALPLWELLGGARDSASAHTADTARPGLDADAVVALARSLLKLGFRGLRVTIGGPNCDPETDAQFLQTVRDAVGGDVWFGVTVRGGYDYDTALPMGRFIEEDIGADWFEDPVPEGDLVGLSRLAAKLDTPIAAGSRLTEVAGLRRSLETGAVAVLRPDVVRLGGITPWLNAVAVAEAFARPVVPRLLPEVGIHLACGRAGVAAVEHVSTLQPLFPEALTVKAGRLVPPSQPGLGLTPDTDAEGRGVISE